LKTSLKWAAITVATQKAIKLGLQKHLLVLIPVNVTISTLHKMIGDIDEAFFKKQYKYYQELRKAGFSHYQIFDTTTNIFSDDSGPPIIYTREGYIDTHNAGGSAKQAFNLEASPGIVLGLTPERDAMFEYFEMTYEAESRIKELKEIRQKTLDDALNEAKVRIVREYEKREADAAKIKIRQEYERLN